MSWGSDRSFLLVMELLLELTNYLIILLDKMVPGLDLRKTSSIIISVVPLVGLVNALLGALLSGGPSQMVTFKGGGSCLLRRRDRVN